MFHCQVWLPESSPKMKLDSSPWFSRNGNVSTLPARLGWSQMTRLTTAGAPSGTHTPRERISDWGSEPHCLPGSKGPTKKHPLNQAFLPWNHPLTSNCGGCFFLPKKWHPHHWGFIPIDVLSQAWCMLAGVMDIRNVPSSGMRSSAKMLDVGSYRHKRLDSGMM